MLCCSRAGSALKTPRSAGPAITFAKPCPAATNSRRTGKIVLFPYYHLRDGILGHMVDLDRRFGFLVHDVARLYGRRFDRNGRRLGLTPVSYTHLRAHETGRNL